LSNNDAALPCPPYRDDLLEIHISKLGATSERVEGVCIGLVVFTVMTLQGRRRDTGSRASIS
jgi:hypothetical protein